MESKWGVRIAGTGRAVPDKILTNEDLSRIVDTTDEWITTRTGIKTRHIADASQKNSDFSSLACQRALEDAGVEASEIDYLIIATVTGDYIFPSTAVVVQNTIGAVNAAAWDVSAACTGWLFGVTQARALLGSGMGKRALVVGCEMLSRITNWDDRSTCVLFGDGAGAMLLEACEPKDNSLLATWLRSDGSLVDLLWAPKGGSAGELQPENLTDGSTKINMKGNEVFKYAVRNMGQAAHESLKIAGMDAGDIDWLFPHQANIRIMTSLAGRLGIPREKVYINIQKYGNTSSASIPIALDEAREKGALTEGQIVLSVAFGGGLTWGSAIFRF